MPDRLYPDQNLWTNGSITSKSGDYHLVMKDDGNLVLYRSDGRARWSTGTSGRNVSNAVMRRDGNFVMVGPDGEVWSTGTDGHPGAWLAVQDDGNAVIYGPDGDTLWTTSVPVQRAMVPGFSPSRSGFKFSNRDFAPAPLLRLPPISVAGVQVGIGNAAHGLCGGMVFATRDLFEAGITPPALTTPPSSGPLFDYLVRRLFDSFDLPSGVATYMLLMNPLFPDHETPLSRLGVAPHGRAWVMIREQWPRIKEDIDHQRLSPIGLVQVESADPRLLGKNHVVLVYGYELDGNDLALHVYDPSFPNVDDARICLSIADPRRATAVTRTHGARRIRCFVRLDYKFTRPPAGVF